MKFLKSHLTTVLMASGLLTGIGTGLLLFRPALFRSAPRDESSPPLVIDRSSAPPGAQPPHIRGAAGAPVTLEEFGDFECPPCGQLHRVLKQIETDHGPSARFIFRHFPLTSIHEKALEAARAAEAAGVQGRFWEMHDRIFENQEAWAKAPDARAVFTDYARALKLDVRRFVRDMDAQEVNERIVSDRRRGEAIGIRGTPTLFINDRELQPEEWTPEGLRKAIFGALDGRR